MLYSLETDYNSSLRIGSGDISALVIWRSFYIYADRLTKTSGFSLFIYPGLSVLWFTFEMVENDNNIDIYVPSRLLSLL